MVRKYVRPYVVLRLRPNLRPTTLSTSHYLTLSYGALHCWKESVDEDSASSASAYLHVGVLTERLASSLCHEGSLESEVLLLDTPEPFRL